MYTYFNDHVINIVEDADVGVKLFLPELGRVRLRWVAGGRGDQGVQSLVQGDILG